MSTSMGQVDHNSDPLDRTSTDHISDRSGIVTHRVHVPAHGLSVAGDRERVRSFGVDPDSPHGRFVGMLEQPEPAWEAVVTFEVGAQGIVPTGVEVHSTRGEPVTRGVWDAVRVGHIIREAADVVAWLGPATLTREQVQPFETAPQKRGRGKGRPAIYSDDHYRRVGQVYAAAEVNGKAPVRAVAHAFSQEFPGLTGPTDRRARGWVRAARARGFITEKGGQ